MSNEWNYVRTWTGDVETLAHAVKLRTCSKSQKRAQELFKRDADDCSPTLIFILHWSVTVTSVFKKSIFLFSLCPFLEIAG